MKSILIEVSDPNENGCVKITSKRNGEFTAFEIVGILETVKSTFIPDKMKNCDEKPSSKKRKQSKIKQQ